MAVLGLIGVFSGRPQPLGPQLDESGWHLRSKAFDISRAWQERQKRNTTWGGRGLAIGGRAQLNKADQDS